MKLRAIRYACCLSFALLSCHVWGQQNLRDLNGVAYPATLCNEQLFSPSVTGDSSFQILEQSIFKDPLFPVWTHKPMLWSCNLNDIVWANLEWWIAYSRFDIQPEEPSNHREHLVVMYSPDFKRWTGMVEILNYLPGKGWQVTRRDWLNDTPPGYRQVLMAQTVDPAVYGMDFQHK